MAVAARDDLRDAGGPLRDDEDFETLRDLLIGPERDRLARLQARFDDPVARGRDLGRALPQALTARTGDAELTHAMTTPVEQAVTASVRRDPRPLADALFPIMGPAIRKAVAASLAAMMESVNRTLEHSLSSRALRWRITALRTGKSFAEIVLLNTLLYRVEQVFLIDRRTGLLLQHVRRTGAPVEDADLVSGMLTAIRDFVNDSFQVKESDSLDSMKVGDLTVVVEQGPRALLAAVVRGTPPPDIRQTLQQALEAIHLQQGDALEAFDGDASAFDAARPTLETCLQAEYRREEKGHRRKLWLALVFLAVLFTIVAVLWFQARSRWQHYLDALAAEPGIVVVSSEAGWGWTGHRVRGLRDAMARDPEALLAQANLRREDVTGHWEPFQALDPGFVLARARTLLSPPAGADLTLDDGVLRARGPASASWIAETRRLGPFIAGVARVDEAPALDASIVAVSERIAAGKVFFELGTTQAVEPVGSVLREWAERLRELDALGGLAGERPRVEVIGHADTLGFEEANVELSRARAEWVLAQLIATPFAHLDLTATGVGSQNPLTAADSHEDRQRDRRVELRVHRAPTAGGGTPRR